MAETLKPDDLVRRVDKIEQRLGEITAVLWRPQQIVTDATDFTVTSDVYNDSAAPFTLPGVRPGPSGLIVVCMAADARVSFTGSYLFCSYVMTDGPTGVSGDDNRAIVLAGSGLLEASIAGYVTSPVLADGVYDISWVSRIVAAGTQADIYSRTMMAFSI